MRKNENFRRLVRETSLSVDNLIMPFFVVEGEKVKSPISSLPGQFHLSVDNLVLEAKKAWELGIPAVLLFGIPDRKDELASAALRKDGILQRAIRGLKKQLPGLVVITDICVCEYTSHGHCGMLAGGQVDNDTTLEVLGEMALSHVQCGADMVAPSAMMDGQVGAIRAALDDKGHTMIPIMAYAAKYASTFYGPFREAAGSSPREGNRRGYQMDPANAREALREITQDVEEGADIVMVKPALAYLDVIRQARENFDLPLAAYNVSGEYAMIRAAAQKGWLDGEGAMMEVLMAIKRAGADMIISYFSLEAAELLRKSR
jgi:porphobilinogen synthase